MNLPSTKTILRLALPVILLLTFTLFLNKTVISNPDVLRAWFEGFGVYAILIYIVVQTAAIVFAPLGGSAFALAVWALFGPFNGSALIYVVTTPAYIINFLLAKRVGKPIIKRFVGEEGLRLINHFMKDLTARRLVFLKLFLGGYFDYIAYAAGFSNISATQFVLVNVLAGIPAALFAWIVMSRAPSFPAAVVILYVMPVVLGALYFGVTHFRKKKETISEEVEVLLDHEA